MSNEIYNIFEKSGALLKGHFQLTSGLHSPIYFQCAKVLQYPDYNQLLADKIVQHFRSHPIDVVISPAVGGIVVGQEVGRLLGLRTIFAERKEGKMQLRRGFELKAGERVLVCEEGADVVGVGVIVDRSNGSVKFSVDYKALVQLEAETYPPDQCPFCQKGDPIEKPGSREKKNS
jgi:orotate phosphoribosyltransferase